MISSPAVLLRSPSAVIDLSSGGSEHEVLATLAEEFHDGAFNLPPLPDIEPVRLEIDEGGELKHAESGLSTNNTEYAYSYRGTGVAAVLGSSRRGGDLSAIFAVMSNWRWPKRCARTSPQQNTASREAEN